MSINSFKRDQNNHEFRQKSFLKSLKIHSSKSETTVGIETTALPAALQPM